MKLRCESCGHTIVGSPSEIGHFLDADCQECGQYAWVEEND